MTQKILDKTTLRFIIVGIVNTIVGTSIMFIAYNLLGFSYWVSSALNYVIGSIVSFFLNKRFTFKDTEKSFLQILRFLIVIVLSYLIAYGVAKPLVSLILSSQSILIKENISMFIGMILFTALNYLGQKFFVFFKKSA